MSEYLNRCACGAGALSQSRMAVISGNEGKDCQAASCGRPPPRYDMDLTCTTDMPIQCSLLVRYWTELLKKT